MAGMSRVFPVVLRSMQSGFSGLQRLWGEVRLDGTYAWNDKWNGYAEADYFHALSGAGKDSDAIKGTAGLRYRW